MTARQRPRQHRPSARIRPSSSERYLDYCSELFSLTSKVAALYGQSLRDPVVLDAVSDIETLGASLSNKVWQKIVVLHGPQAPSPRLQARSLEPGA